MATRTEYHAATGLHFMEKARVCLADDDLLQASEKGWGAAAQAVKAIAEARGWRHKAHVELYRVIDRLAQETGDRELVDLFGAAGNLHVNFYEGWLTRRMVEQYLTRVEELLDKLHSIPA